MKWQLALASVFVALMFFGAIVLNVYLTNKAINASNHQWCSALDLLTQTPPKHGSPEQAFTFYSNLKTLEIRFHC